VQIAPPGECLKVLLVEDDEDDFILTRDLFSEFGGQRVQIDWMKTFSAGLEAMSRNQHDICLVDYRLGAQNGIELLRAAMERGCRAPIILLTGQGEHEIDLEAMKAGAADYLVKGRLDSGLLERSIRYAIERKRASEGAASDQARLAAFGEEVGLALTRRDSLETILSRCSAAMVQYLHAALAQIWIYQRAEDHLQLHASAGAVESPGPLTRQAPKVVIESKVLSEGRPILIHSLHLDPRVADRDWVRREGMVAYAGYPLMLEDRLIGLMSIFSKSPLAEAVLQEMASVANGIALCIERKRSAEALDASEVKYRSVVESIKEVIFQIDREGYWTFLNPAWAEITGFHINETLGKCFTDYIHPDDRYRHGELMREVIDRKMIYCRDETRYIAADGTFRWMEVYAQPILNGNESVFGITGTLSDITERKRAEAEIQKLAAFPRFSPDPVMELAADGTLTYLNNAAREMARQLNVSEPEAILPSNAASLAQECLQQGRSIPSQHLQWNGRTLTWSFVPILASESVHCYGADITERLNLEAQLRHAQKLESVGQLAAGVAHDFNNILTIIQGHTDRLITQCAENVELAEPLKLVSTAAKRASNLTQQLLMFSRKQKMQAKVLNLNKIITNLGQMLQRVLGDHIALESSLEPSLPPIEADTGMIEQIVMNLSVNARDAMPKGGRLRIATTLATIDETYAQLHPEARVGEFVRLGVTDNGTGMSKETLSRIFEPFFTTKEVGKGTGLGLATVYGIVQQHNGWIDVESELGKGTTFVIHLPASSRPFETTMFERAPQKPAVKGGHETILLVEDEPVLRELARVILKDYHYQVLEAGTGAEAIRIWEQHQGKIDLLLTDMVMPEGISGRELAERLRSRKPELKVIYTSGYSEDVMGNEMGVRDAMFLQKPYPPPLLAKTVRECLDF
jgi:PAS domain S-box-containing protein